MALADTYTLYFTRHMEKADDKTDPELSLVGKQRAQVLAQVLKNSNIEAIFSTQFKRTQQTAESLANYLGLPVENYPSKDFKGIMTSIKGLKKNALIVGHSNTVSELIKAAGGTAKALEEDEYGDLFQVVVSDDSVVTNRLYIPVVQ
ncbi:histidine phosphatase family protein [Idiomarina ramblicola]|uniref:Histidine phosphatase family protein n=1 Tax=Idiomarina ramblicola TaxID=263724 RepID=A0A432Z6H9_9GAMM|nr:histidine phosphatase family protein [Idiomarina ramblicola]